MLRQSSTATLVEEIPETPFYIPGTGSSTRPRRTLKHGDCFAVLDSHADIGATPGGPDGIFFCDTRYLSHLEMLLNGTATAAAGLKRPRRQLHPHRRPDQSRHLSRSEARAAEGHAARRAHAFSLARRRLSAPAHAEPRRPPVRRPAFARLRQRLRRPVRGAGTAPRAPRHRNRGGAAKPRLR